MIAAVVALLGGWRGTAFAALALIAGSAYGVQSWRLSRATDALDAAVAAAQAYRTAADLNASAVTQLKSANDEFRAACAVDATKSAETISELQARDAASAAQAWDLKRKLREAYHNDQKSREWAAMPVPGAVAVQLRAAFDGSGGNGGGGSAGAHADAARIAGPD